MARNHGITRCRKIIGLLIFFALFLFIFLAWNNRVLKKATGFKNGKITYLYEIRNAAVYNSINSEPEMFENSEFIVTSGDYNQLLFKGWRTSQPRTFQPRIFQPQTFQTMNFSTLDFSTMKFSTMGLKKKFMVGKSVVEMSLNLLERWNFNPELFNPTVQKFMVEKSGVDKFMVKSGVERSRVEAWSWIVRGWDVLQPIQSQWKFKKCLEFHCKPRRNWYD